jgi:hypothetical protein
MGVYATSDSKEVEKASPRLLRSQFREALEKPIRPSNERLGL